MAILDLMGVFTDIGVKSPVDGRLWEWLILNVWQFIVNYGWRILLFTLAIKLLLSPLDIFQRVSSHKNQKIMAKIAPAMAKLEKQYANDPKLLMQKRNELQKQMGGGMNPLITCLPLILTLVIFITLFNGMNNIGSYKNMQHYVKLYNEYQNVSQVVATDNRTLLSKDGVSDPTSERNSEYEQFYVNGLARYIGTLEDGNALKTTYGTLANTQDYATVKGFVDGSFEAENKAELAKYVGQNAVYKRYHEVVEGFLWIKNIWAVDAPWVSSINSFSEFKKNVARDGYNKKGCLILNQAIIDDGSTNTNEFAKIYSEDTYKAVMGELLADKKLNTENGYMILPILSILLAFLTQFITMQQQKKSGEDAAMGAGGGTMKIMMWIMPVMIGFFSFQYTSAFALYLVVSYFVSIIITLTTTLIFSIMDKKEAGGDGSVIKYGRPNFNDNNK